MTNTNIIKNKDFYVCPEGFYYIGAQEHHLCAHTTFSMEKGTKNVNGQYRLTRKCDSCYAYRTYYLYAKVAKKGRK